MVLSQEETITYLDLINKMQARIYQLEQDNANLARQYINLAKYKSLELERHTRQKTLEEK